MDTIAAFDFDGTLTYHDTLIPFLKFCVGQKAMMCNLIKIAPYAIGFATGLKTRQQVKERFMSYALKGRQKQQIEEFGAEFAKNALPALLNPVGMERLKWHQKNGHRCILVSATLDCFLSPWSKAMGFDDLICSKLHYDSESRFSGKLQGLNCWGREKVVQLDQLLGFPKNYTLYAYGDSPGDKELLAYADYPFYREFGHPQ